MNFIDLNIFKKSASLATGKVNNQDMLEFFKYGSVTSTSPYQQYKYYETNAPLGDAVDMIANKFSDIRPVIKDVDGNVIDRPEVEKALRVPNDFESYNEFALNLSINYLLSGNAFFQVMGNFNRSPSMIVNVPSDKISVSTGSNQINYIVNTTGFFEFLSGNFVFSAKQPRILDSSGSDLREMYQVKGFYQDSDSLLSKSKLNSIVKEMDVIDQSLVKMKSLLTNGFSAASLASIKTSDVNVFDQFRRDLQNQFTGAGSARVVASMGDSLDFKNIEQSNKDLQTMENKTDSKKTVYSRYEIPQALIDQSAQTYNNYQTALYSLYDSAIIPLSNKIFVRLTKVFRDRNMLSDSEYIGFDHSSIPCLQLRLAEEMKLLKQVGVHSINEIRAVYGSETIGPEGDDIYMPGNLIPIGEDDMTDDNPKEKRRKQLMESFKKSGISEEEVQEYVDEYEKIISKK